MKTFLVMIVVLAQIGAMVGTAGALLSNYQEANGRPLHSGTVQDGAVFVAAVFLWPATIAGRGAYKIIRSEKP